ncbi:DUF721 domain-containing protein [Streptomyces katrae]|uniref:DUF721 domain-containing protein n=1 Tax=Streptomyces katrae TaxID=68223 RepID=UPI0006991017|nr:DUF721 domain-containing protein [Streptomyces katrae]
MAPVAPVAIPAPSPVAVVAPAAEPECAGIEDDQELVLEELTRAPVLEAWELPAVGATLRERWAAIAPELAGHVATVALDTDSGRLTVCPESSAWATKARLEQTRVITAANTAAGRTVVISLPILPPAPVSAPADVAPADLAPTVPADPAKTRESSEGYCRALAARQEAVALRRADPAIAKAVERQRNQPKPPPPWRMYEVTCPDCGQGADARCTTTGGPNRSRVERAKEFTRLRKPRPEPGAEA